MKRVKTQTILFLAILSIFALAGDTKAEVVVFADAALEGAIREQIGMPAGDIHESDLAAIDILHASGKGIVDISGIGRCTNLEVLDLSDNSVADVSELADLPNLTMIDLDDNGIEDIDPIADLTSLTSLSLSYNKFNSADLDVAISGIANLVYLNLSGNRLTEL